MSIARDKKAWKAWIEKKERVISEKLGGKHTVQVPKRHLPLASTTQNPLKTASSSESSLTGRLVLLTGAADFFAGKDPALELAQSGAQP